MTLIRGRRWRLVKKVDEVLAVKTTRSTESKSLSGSKDLR